MTSSHVTLTVWNTSVSDQENPQYTFKPPTWRHSDVPTADLLDDFPSRPTVVAMNESPKPLSPISARFATHFSIAEFRFRWLEATGLDRSLPSRANHIAARISSLWIFHDSATTSYDELCRITQLSLRTVQRGLKDLESSGFLVVTRHASQINLTLVITDSGMEVLLAERERRRSFAGRRELNDEWATSVTAEVLRFYGTDETEARHGLWPVLASKIRSIVSHMQCFEIEAAKLVAELTESPPTEIQDLPAFLLSRAATHIRNYPHLARSAPTPAPLQRGPSALDEILKEARQRTSWPTDL